MTSPGYDVTIVCVFFFIYRSGLLSVQYVSVTADVQSFTPNRLSVAQSSLSNELVGQLSAHHTVKRYKRYFSTNLDSE